MGKSEKTGLPRKKERVRLKKSNPRGFPGHTTPRRGTFSCEGKEGFTGENPRRVNGLRVKSARKQEGKGGAHRE